MRPQLLADAVLMLHAGVVFFVMGALVAVVLGHRLRWRWTAHRGFRLLHLGTVGFIVVQAWLGQHCPLTLLESRLRAQTGSPTYEQTFIEHWLHKLLYVDAPAWVFTLAYSVFGAVVLWAWWSRPINRD